MVMNRTSAVEVSIQAVLPVSSAGVMASDSWPGATAGSQRGRARLAGPDTDRLGEIDDEDLAVADLAGARGSRDRLDDAMDLRIVDRDLDPRLRNEVDLVLGTAIDLGVPLLPAVPLHL